MTIDLYTLMVKAMEKGQALHLFGVAPLRGVHIAKGVYGEHDKAIRLPVCGYLLFKLWSSGLPCIQRNTQRVCTSYMEKEASSNQLCTLLNNDASARHSNMIIASIVKAICGGHNV